MVTERCKGCEFYSDKVLQIANPEGVLIKGEYYKLIIKENSYKEYYTKLRLHFDYVDKILDGDICHKYVPKIIASILNIPRRGNND